MRLALTAAAFLAVAITAGITPAVAQKSKDTLRLGLNDPFIVMTNYHYSGDEAANFNRGIYESLIAYDERGKKWVPWLAKSWTRVNPTTLEFDLRDNVTFHNGSKFDADDVVATINYLKDPASTVLFKQRYTWIDKVEKLGPYKVRIVSKEPNATDMQIISYRFSMWDAETLAKHTDKEDYGRLTPVGTGAMKVAFMDKNKGVMIEAVDNYYGDKQYFGAKVKRIHGVPMPDRQTQIAQLLTGGIDMIRGASQDDARELGANPNLEVTHSNVLNLYYMGFDTKGRSGSNLFSDARVRKAVWMAIDRDAIVEYIIPGGSKVAEKGEALCFKTTMPECNPSIKLPKFDPEGAKKLLAEAGYPNGIEYTYTVTAPHRAIAEAISGSLLKANIRASVKPVPLSVYRKDQGDGKVQAWSTVFPTGGHPDASNNLNTLLLGVFDQYYGDEDLKKLLDAGLKEFDEKKRAEIYHKAYDMVNEKAYLYPLSSIPNSYVHTKEVRVLDNPLFAGETGVTDYAWK